MANKIDFTKLKEIRLKKNFSQEAVAKDAGINDASYSRIETGKTKGVSLQHMESFAKTFHLSLADLITKLKE